MKRLVFCFDGTWNKLSTNCPTNVVLVAEMVAPIAKGGVPQIVYYDEGIGTAKSEHFMGGAFGKGMMTNIREAYRFLLFNYEPGDQIYAFGFSRGAFTARSFLGFIRHAGILDVDSAEQIDQAIAIYKGAFKGDGDDALPALKFRAQHSSQVCVSEWDRDWRRENCPPVAAELPILEIKYLGVWDTVAALGCPKLIPGSTWINRKWRFHDAKLTSKVKMARHALAIDERRVLFEPVLWDNVAELNAKCEISTYDPEAPYQQKWFPGVHGSVGGGGPVRGLSDGALAWVLKGAKKAGLELRLVENARAYSIKPNPFAALRNDPELAWHDRQPIASIKSLLLSSDRIGPDDIVNVSASARRRWNAPATVLPDKKSYRPKTLKLVADRMQIGATVAESDRKNLQPHEVQGGDTLAKLAKRYLGDTKRYDEIFDANRDQLDDPDEIFVGMVLKIPVGKGDGTES
ncbi:MAG: DUF2235 domain-containing protein [Sphingomonadales bacterium]|nr:DUF2235 domain-containing protein [Sphingomonadales bacterium]